MSLLAFTRISAIMRGIASRGTTRPCARQVTSSVFVPQPVPVTPAVPHCAAKAFTAFPAPARQFSSGAASSAGRPLQLSTTTSRVATMATATAEAPVALADNPLLLVRHSHWYTTHLPHDQTCVCHLRSSQLLSARVLRSHAGRGLAACQHRRLHAHIS